MKILHITSTPVFYPGGMEKVILELSKIFSKKHEVTILQTGLYYSESNKDMESTFDGIKIITRKNDYFLFGYGYSWSFKKKLREIWREYDLVHVHGCGRFTTDFSLKFLKDKLPMIFTAHGFFHTDNFNLLKRINKMYLKKLFRSVFCFTALTKNEFSEYEKYGINVSKIFEIPNGVDLKRFVRDEEEVNKLVKRYSVKGNVVLYVGRIHKSKGLEYLVRAVKNVDCKVLFIGRDEGYKEELIKIADSLRIKSKIVFTGSVLEKELIASYFASKIFVLPSSHEGFGIVVIEAMACGLPVVVSNRGSLPFIVEDGKNGFVTAFGNAEEITLKLNRLLEDKKLRDKISKNNLISCKKYNWENIAEKYENLYKMVLTRA